MKSEFTDDIRNALKILRAGGVILYPTDTIWGLGCDATNAEAVSKIYDIKQRASNKSLIVLVNSADMLTRYVDHPPEVALQIAELSDTPLTIVYDRGRSLAGGVASDDGSVGVRICNDPFCDELITALRKPLVSTSANISGDITPARFDEISGEVKASVDYICLWRQDDRSRAKASSVIRVSGNGVVKILRG
ncbi:MAG: L-threonylcarbamoyladenylate synthase [Bacteroidales bacterium]|jgi:L-threonylcarbamoyladenylate synthase|nr:L-threonylcarbamoyladenylate synthase [Bacteroidales bacterium]